MNWRALGPPWGSLLLQSNRMDQNLSKNERESHSSHIFGVARHNESTHMRLLGLPSGMLGVHVHVRELSKSDWRAIHNGEKLLPSEIQSAHGSSQTF